MPTSLFNAHQLPVEEDWDLSDFDMDEDVDTKDEL